MNNILKKISNYIIHKDLDEQLNGFMPVLDFNQVNNVFLSKNKKILFVIPKMGKFMGGLTSVLRVAKILSRNEYQIYFASYNSNEINEMSRNAECNLKDYEGHFITFEEAIKTTFEYVIATNWQSVYFSKKLKGYKIFFVQDYEPYFYPLGENWLLAKKSYQQNFEIISLGNWNIEQIKQNIKLDDNIFHSVDFPFEKKEYPTIDRNYFKYSLLTKIKFAVYTKRESKRIPTFLFSFFEKANGYAKSKGIELEIYYFGLNKHEKLNFGINCGRLTKSQIFDLYKECHFGMVASLTNISLVPYEMLSTGLPVFEVEDGSYSAFLGNNTATLLDLNYQHFIDQLITLLKNPNLIVNQIEQANIILKDLSWDKTGQQFANILNSLER